jgi:hypothetical protein
MDKDPNEWQISSLNYATSTLEEAFMTKLILNDTGKCAYKCMDSAI